MMKLDDILNELRTWLIDNNAENEKADIFIFTGINIALRFYKRNDCWEVKVADCSRCGTCCSLMTGKSFPFSSPNGCTHLIKSGPEYLCGLSYFRPNGCAVAEVDIEECTVEWESIK